MKTRELNAVQEAVKVIDHPEVIKHTDGLYRAAKDMFDYIDCSKEEFTKRIRFVLETLNSEKILRGYLDNETPKIEHSELGHAAFIEETGHDPNETDLLFVEATKKRVLEILGDTKAKGVNY